MHRAACEVAVGKVVVLLLDVVVIALSGVVR